MGGTVLAQRRGFRGHGDVRISHACWDPGCDRVLGVMQISHGMGEHIGRYARSAEQLAELGVGVCGADHRGHGLSIGARRQPGNSGPGGAAYAYAAPVFALIRRAGAAGPLKDAPIRYAGALVSSCAATTMEFMLTHPEQSDVICHTGLETVWHALH